MKMFHVSRFAFRSGAAPTSAKRRQRGHPHLSLHRRSFLVIGLPRCAGMTVLVDGSERTTQKIKRGKHEACPGGTVVSAVLF